MRRHLTSLTRGLSAAIVIATLMVPVTYAAPREIGDVPVKDRIVRIIRHLISIVSGDSLSEPKPTPPAAP